MRPLRASKLLKATLPIYTEKILGLETSKREPGEPSVKTQPDGEELDQNVYDDLYEDCAFAGKISGTRILDEKSYKEYDADLEDEEFIEALKKKQDIHSDLDMLEKVITILEANSSVKFKSYHAKKSSEEVYQLFDDIFERWFKMKSGQECSSNLPLPSNSMEKLQWGFDDADIKNATDSFEALLKELGETCDLSAGMEGDALGLLVRFYRHWQARDRPLVHQVVTVDTEDKEAEKWIAFAKRLPDVKASNKKLVRNPGSSTTDQLICQPDRDNRFPSDVSISQVNKKLGVGKESQPKKITRKIPYQRKTKSSKVEVLKSVNSTTPSTWVRVNSAKNLPPINSVIEAKWPGHEHSNKCTILSKAGKASKGNWHYLNIREDGEEKCSSFIDVAWKFIQDNDNSSSSTPITIVEICFE